MALGNERCFGSETGPTRARLEFETCLPIGMCGMVWLAARGSGSDRHLAQGAFGSVPKGGAQELQVGRWLQVGRLVFEGRAQVLFKQEGFC